MKRKEDERKICSLRPHHGMCLAFFIGEGYSDAFTQNMANMLAFFTQEEGAKAQLQDNSGRSISVRLCLHADEICRACPNRRPEASDVYAKEAAAVSGAAYACVSEEAIIRYDMAVLSACGLKEGDILPFNEFALIVQKKIIENSLRGKICGECCWNDICENTPSRWLKL